MKQNHQLFNMISEDKKLELRLAPPSPEKDKSQIFLGYNNNNSIAFSVAANTVVTDGSNKRAAPAAVVGWPPIGSFRKNITGSSLSKPASISIPDETTKETIAGKTESFKSNLFVKINMEGVPIGRKINISAYNSYEELSFAIDELFKGLLPAQRDPFSIARSDEYTLLYEDSEGDRMLVGDVPWHMFVSTGKKLLVLKSSELSPLQTFGIGKEKTTT